MSTVLYIHLPLSDETRFSVRFFETSISHLVRIFGRQVYDLHVSVLECMTFVQFQLCKKEGDKWNCNNIEKDDPIPTPGEHEQLRMIVNSEVVPRVVEGARRAGFVDTLFEADWRMRQLAADLEVWPDPFTGKIPED